MYQQGIVPEYLYKIVSEEDWKKSKLENMVVKSAMDKEFIHLATKEQLASVTKKFWENQCYIILKLDVKQLSGRLIQEKNPGGTTLYYHLYEGNIPLDAVVVIKEIPN
jgi:uncharacterized protein (DUF952 family)